MKLFPKKPRLPFRTDTVWQRFVTRMHFLWADHAYLRLGFMNAHWIGPDMVRTNQPWPFQLAHWQKKGIRTVINLRGGRSSFYYLEDWACRKLGLVMEEFGLTSRSLPTAQEIREAVALFERIQYPALLHCKSGADRAGMMSVLYAHFHLKQPIEVAAQQLSFKYLHSKAGLTGVLDHLFEVYLRDVAPKSISFYDWTQSADYDPNAIKADFKASWWGTLMTEKLLRRE